MDKKLLIERLIKENKITLDEALILLEQTPVQPYIVQPYNPYPMSPTLPYTYPPIFYDCPTYVTSGYYSIG